MDEFGMKTDSSVREKQVGDFAKHHSSSANTAPSVRRIFSFIQMFFFALSYMSSWEAMATNIGLIFWNGGPRAMVWGFFIVIPGVLCQVASIAELSSVQPIAGAQYHWTWHYAPIESRRFITWLQGWITWFSWIALLAGVVNIAANVTTQLVMTSYPDFVLQGWHTVLIMYAFLIAFGALNMYAFWTIPWIELLAGFLHIILWIVFAVVLLTMAPQHPSDFVFFEKANMSGWHDDFVSFNLGIILITWGFVGFDAVVHVSEETQRARSAIPRALFWSICMNSALAFGMVIIFIYSLGDVEEISNSLYPLIIIAINATRSVAGGSAMVGAFLCTVITATIGSVVSTSRITWAWARDGALPNYFAHVDRNHRIPLRSTWLPIVAVMLLSLLNLAHATAFSVIISLSTFGLYQSYLITIACVLVARLSGRFEEAPWSLGNLGVPVNAFAILFSAWIGVFLVFPAYRPITAMNMNYALPINAFIWLFAIASWFAWGKKQWPGLNVEVIRKVVADGDRNTKD